MINGMVAPISHSTARDMVIGILEDVTDLPTLAGAERIAEEYMKRGAYIKPEFLLEVWKTMQKGGEQDG